MYSEFWRCGVCRRVYWEGNTFRQALAHYARFAEPKKPGAAAEGEGEVSEILTRKLEFEKGSEVAMIAAEPQKAKRVKPSQPVPFFVICVSESVMYAHSF